jgi:catechol 2,3-dioxygenase-like lactoylglutathione lyase family enzyme
MTSSGFDHMTIVVTDREETLRFFSVLGFVESKSVIAKGETISAYMGIPGWEAEHVTLVLQGCPVHQEIQFLVFHQPPIELDEQSGYLSRSGFNHVCFRVEDLDKTVAAMEEAGFSTRNEVMDFHDRRLVFLNGPAGVVVELAEWQTDPDSQVPAAK